MEPKKNCNICKRLVDYRNQNKILFPDFYNDRVLGLGSLSSELLIVGLAPGLKGANRTGKIFNGDYSGNLLFNFLKKYKISESGSEFKETGYINCRITNAVKCLPPNNKPNSFEVKKCNDQDEVGEVAVVRGVHQRAHQECVVGVDSWKDVPGYSGEDLS